MRHRRPVATLIGAATLMIGVVLLAAVAASEFFGSGGEGRSGKLAMRIDRVENDTRGAPRAARRPSRPVRIEIPTIGVDAPIVPLGLNPDRTLEVPTERVYGRTRNATLRLITCSGTFDHASGHYLDNTVVYAVSA